MIRLYSFLISLFSAERGSSFLSAAGGIWGFFGVLGKFIVRVVANFFAKCANFFKEASWAIIKFVLGIVDAFQFMIEEFLGISRDSEGMMHGVTVDEMVTYAENNQTGATSFLSVLSTTFRAILAVSIVLLIIFTIIAIIRQEYTAATQAASDGNSNDKRPIIIGMFKKMLYIILLPLTMIFIITGVNSILAAFSRAMSGQVNMTIASQILATSTYDSNKYRYYAQQDRRVPIVINTYNPDDYDPDENDLLVQKIKSISVQGKLQDTIVNINNRNLLTFKEALTYKNNRLTNSVEYGDFYEQFICTPEQYQVMADFVDYAQKTNLNFQIRSLDDPAIEWKYVDSAVFNANDVSLKINYHDLNDLNNNGSVKDSYTIEYSTSFEVTSPITDSMKTIQALLGIDEYADNLYKTMERDENSVNLVNWQNEKVLIQLSEDFVLNNPSSWSRLDQLIMYEYYHFASNNTFGNYSIQDLMEGVELDAAQIVYREYYPEANAYSAERTKDCVKINGSYYNTVKDPRKTDSYGNVYYVLKDSLVDENGVSVSNTTFLNNEYARIEKVEGSAARLLLTGKSTGFNVNNPATWAYSDQILIYEFFSDLTYNNMLYIYDFSEFMGVDTNDDGDLDKFVDVPVYKITHAGLDGTTEKEDLNGIYVLLNGTYYKVKEANSSIYHGDTGVNLYSLWGDKDDTSNNFINEATPYTDNLYYNYTITLDASYADAYGITTETGNALSADHIVSRVETATNISTLTPAFVPLEQDDANYLKYSSYSISLSRNFDFADVNTWTYKDYFLFYLYSCYPKITGNLGLDSLRIAGLSGNVGKIGGTYVFQVKYDKYNPGGGVQDLYLYIDIDKSRAISDMLINRKINSINLGQLMTANRVDNTNELFINVNVDDLKTAHSEVHKFNLSEGFLETVPGSWTVLDYILYTFSEQDKISSVADIKEKGYSSVKYILENDVVYQLGPSAEKTYLSLNGIKSLVDIDNNSLNFLTERDFLEMPLVDYIAKLYRTTSNELVTNEDGVVDALYKELSPYIYDIDTMIEMIVNKNGFKLDSSIDPASPNKFEVFDNVSEFTYTPLPGTKVNEMSTWTRFDELLYALTGSFQTKYTSKVIYYNDDNGTTGDATDDTEYKYFVVGDYAVDISSDEVENPVDPGNMIDNPFKSTLVDGNVINSPDTSFVVGTDTIDVFYQNRYKDYVITKTPLAYKNTATTSNFDRTYKSLTGNSIVINTTYNLYVISYNNELYVEVYNDDTNTYYYVKIDSYSTNAIVSDVQPEIVNGFKVTDYANSKFKYTRGLSSSTYTAFDIVYEKLMGTALLVNTSVEYDVFSVNGKLYIEFNNSGVLYYLEVTESYGSTFSVMKKSSINPVDTAKVAVVDPMTFVSFNNTIDEESNDLQLSSLNYSKIDAIIYSITGEMNSKTYSVYNRGGELYTYVDNQYVKVDDDLVANKNTGHLAENETEFPTITLNPTNYQIQSAPVSTLYENYYESLIIEVIGSVITASATDVTYSYVKNDARLDITNISPFALILAKKGLINLNTTEEVEISGTVVTSQRGRKYFKFNGSLNGNPLQFNVDITDIAHTFVDETDTSSVKLIDNAVAKYEMVLRYMLLNNGVTESEYISSLTSYKNDRKDYYEVLTTDKNTLKTPIEKTAGFDFKEPTASDWTIYNLLVYNLTGFAPAEEAIVYIDAAGNRYVEITDGMSSVYTQISLGTNIISTLFTKIETTSINYEKKNASGEYTPLGIIASKATDVDNGTITKVLVDDMNFYFLVDGIAGTYSAVYGLNEDAIRSKNTEGLYSYYFAGSATVSNWSVFDTLIALVANTTSAKTYLSNIYIYGSNAYYLINEDFVNLSKIRVLTSAGVDNIFNRIGDDALDINYQLSPAVTPLKNFYNSTTVGHKAVTVIDDINSLVPDVDDDDDDDEENNRIYFSEDFDISDFSTWTHADLILYYMFVEYPNYFSNASVTISNFQQLIEQGYAPAYEFNHIVDDGFGNTEIAKVIWVGVDETGGTGVALNKAVFQTYYNKLVTNFDSIIEGDVLKYSIGTTARDLPATSDPVPQTMTSFYITKNIALNTNDFIYENYFYFTLEYGYINNLLAQDYSAIGAGTGQLETSINIALGQNLGTDIDDRKGFDISRPETWTWLEFIVIYEFSNVSIRHNFFEGMSFDDLFVDNYVPVFTNDRNEFIIEFNGNYYNLNAIDYVHDGDEAKLSSAEIASIIESRIQVEEDDGGDVLTVDDAVHAGSDTRSQMKTLRHTYEYMAKKETDYALNYTKTPESILYSYKDSPSGKNSATFTYMSTTYNFYVDADGNVSFDGATETILRGIFGASFTASADIANGKITIGGNTLNFKVIENGTIYYLTLNTEIIQTYQISFASLNSAGNYTITNVVRIVNWPQKLMNDIQTIYPDLNWATLLATDGWLDTLGVFTSAQASGEYESSGNSANITAAGLVLSEFFLSVIKMPEDFTSRLEYEYIPVFDTDTIKALMLSMLGEEEYHDLSMQAEVFMDMFNEFFVPILEDIANERGVELVEGKVDNFYISVYKAFLATVLMSSDMAEYFYKIATRVYAQYTILDALASASGDYAAYSKYINMLSGADDNGVTSFNYANFHQLTLYENSFSGNTNPTFTFNIHSTINGLYGQGLTYRKLSNQGYAVVNSTGNEDKKVTKADAKKTFENEDNFAKLVDDLDTKYEAIYIDSHSRVKDNNETGYYCYLFDAYWSIRQNLDDRNMLSTTYLANYHKYLLGEIKRWYHISDVSTEQASAYIPDQQSYEMNMLLSSVMTELSGVSIYMPDADQFEIEEGDNLWDVIKEAYDTATQNSDQVLKTTFKNNTNLYSDYRRAYENVFDMSNKLIGNDVTGILGIMSKSEKGDTSETYRVKLTQTETKRVDAWNRLLSMRDDLEILVNELGSVIDAAPGSYVEGDNSRGYRDPSIDDGRYAKAYEELQNFYTNLDTYISNQKIIDIIYKTSITFTLAQFGKNYVTEGYKFEFENKEYTLKSASSPERIAEYVYGGAFLARYGVAAVYTTSEYHGFVENYRVYDSKENVIKTHLNVWTEMRSFASELANYTARLYYLSNMNDLSGNVGDAILLTDTVYKGKSSGGASVDRTLEHMILEYILQSDLSADTLLRLIFGDSSESLDDLNVDPAKEIYALAYFLEGKNYTTNSDTGNIRIEIGEDPDKEIFEMSSYNKRQYLSKYLELVANDASYDSFGYYHDGSNTGKDRIHTIFKKVISYLVVTEEEGESVAEDAVKLDDITFKDFRKLMVKTLGEYEKNPSETDLENSNRYITLFNLVCSQFSYTYKASSEDIEAGTAVSAVYAKNIDGRAYYIHQTNTGLMDIPLYADFSIDVPTRDIILTLAGVANRPIEELVGLEYDSLYASDEEYDEADGDVFIVCTYDEMEGLYYPILARNPDTVIPQRHKDYISKYNIDVTTRIIESDYGYPIVAKGVIDAAGNPTAIKIVNNSVLFYRTGITTTTTVGEGALSYTKSGGEITTIGYTKYVAHTYKNAKGAEKMAMFTGSSNIDTMINSKILFYFIQVDDLYSITDETNFDAISVLDQFSAFYTLESKQYAMFLLGFATIIPMLFKASGAVLRRILDLIFLVLMGPLAISATGIAPEQGGNTKSKIFDTWKNYLTQTLLHVFGYIIAFNVYYILVSTVLQMELVSDNTMDMIYRIGGLSGIITKDSVNAFMRLIYTLCAAGALETSADLLVKIVTAGKADQAFSTAMSKDVMGDVKKVVQEIKAKAQMAKNFINGKVIVQAKDFALETAKNIVPGGAVIDAAVRKGQDIASDVKGKVLEKGAERLGVPPQIAKKMGKQYAENEKKQRDAKRQNRTKNANEFLGNFGVGDGKFFDAPPPSAGKGKKPKGKGGGGGKKKKSSKSKKKKK